MQTQTSSPAPATRRRFPVWAIAGAAIALIAICGVLAVGMSSISATQDEFSALAPACQGRGVAAAASYAGGAPALMGIRTLESGLTNVYPYAVPDELKAGSLSAVQVALCLDWPEEVLIERCPYTKNGDDPESVAGVVERYQFEQRLRLVTAQTGEVIAETTLQGSAPRACLDSEAFRRGQETITVTGDEVNNATIQAWVSGVFTTP